VKGGERAVARSSPQVAVWTIAPIATYTPAQLAEAARIHTQLARGPLVLAPPRGKA